MTNLTDLAATRLRNNAGRYMVVRVDDEWHRVVSHDDDIVWIEYPDRVYDPYVRTDEQPVNASRARDNTLDALEELADCHNIIGVLLRERLAADEELTAAAELLITQLEQQLREAAVTLGRIRVRLPSAYLSDLYPVVRDEVTT